MINQENWSYTQYKTQTSRVFVSFGAKPEKSGQLKSIYFVTVSDPDYKENFQNEFEQLNEALSFINKKYAHLDQVDTRIASSSSGCATCVAH